MYPTAATPDAVLTNRLCQVPMVMREKKHSMVPLSDQMSAVYEYHAVSSSLEPMVKSWMSWGERAINVTIHERSSQEAGGVVYSWSFVWLRPRRLFPCSLLVSIASPGLAETYISNVR